MNLPANTPILITGCQRSGTTLLSLILDSHPQITSVDEMSFNYRKLGSYLAERRYYPAVAFKLPAYAHAVRSFNRLPKSRVIWCIRDPRDVVSSMMSLQLKLDQNNPVSWADHPLGAQREIQSCISGLHNQDQVHFSEQIKQYQQVLRRLPTQRTRQDSVFSAALCWLLKASLLSAYQAEGISFHLLKYEELLAGPEIRIRDILGFLGLPWHENVLQHHKLHSGSSVGNTSNTRKIDLANTGKWKDGLDAGDLEIIEHLCGEMASGVGYAGFL